MLVHVLTDVQLTDNGVQFELDAQFPAPLGYLVQFLYLISGAPANCNVGRFVE